MQQATDTAAFSAALKAVLVGGGIGPDWDAAADEWMDMDEERLITVNDAAQPVSKRQRQEGPQPNGPPSWAYIGRHPAEQTESTPTSNEEPSSATPPTEPLQNVYIGKSPAVVRAQTRSVSACSAPTRHSSTASERSPLGDLRYKLRSRKKPLSKPTR